MLARAESWVVTFLSTYRKYGKPIHSEVLPHKAPTSGNQVFNHESKDISHLKIALSELWPPDL